MTMAEIPTAPLASYNLQDDESTEIIDHAEEITTDMKQCYSLSQTVKALALVDLFFAIMYAINNAYFFIPIIIIIVGYVGAKRYNLNYIGLYLIYTFIINVARIYFVFYIYYHLTPDKKSDDMFNFITSLMCTLIGIWLLHMIWKLHYLIRKLTSDELEFLQQLSNYSNYTVILW